MSDEPAIQESNASFIAAWKYFSHGLPGHHIEDSDGLVIILSGTQMALLNVAVLSSPAHDPEDLERRARRALTVVERVGQRGVPWLFVVPEAFAPGGDPEAAADALIRLGFQRSLVLTGMATSALTPPRHEAAGLELRRVSDAETRAALADLNCGCYGIPLPAGRATIAHESIWTDLTFGRVGYVDGQPVCCTATFIVEGTAYVGFVATAAEHRRKGYGEAVMRSSLDDALSATGIRRTALHATDMGRPVYEAMGYRALTRFFFYAPPEEAAGGAGAA